MNYAGIPIKVTLAEWYKANALVPEIYEWLGQHGIEPTGGPIYRYRAIGDTEHEFDLEIGVPVATSVEGDGRVLAATLPAGPYVVMVHEGHPDRQTQSHAALHAWATARRLEFDKTGEGRDEVWTARYETYMTNPAVQPDPEQWSTEIAYLIKEVS
jgi:effector-binding domain-containing protein